MANGAESSRGETFAAFDSSTLTRVLESVPAFVIRLDADLCIRYINRLQPGFRLQDVLGRSTFDYVDPSYHDMHRATIERARDSMVASSYVIAGQGADGQPAYYETRVVPLRDADGSIGLTLIAMEITEHVLRGEALAASEEKLRLAVDATGVGLWSWDVTTNAVEWSDAMYEIIGSDKPLHPSEYTSTVVHPRDRKMLDAEIERVPEDTHRHLEHRIVRPSDGCIRHVVSRSRAVRDETGAVSRLIGGTMDVTEARVLQEQLQQAQKLDAIGSLTAGVAHNFNNMLSVIIPALELLGSSANADDGAVVDDALHAANRAAELIEQLMTFGGQARPVARAVFRLDDLVARVVDMCRRTFDREISIDVDFPRTAVSIDASPTKIEQVLVNLLINARDALKAGTRVGAKICVSVESVDAAQAKSRGVAMEPTPERFARLVVADNGIGMSAEEQAHLFEPFFTTKEVGRGTGLGLATSYAIVRERGGFITCTSEEGKGSEFSVYLPMASQADAPSDHPATAQERQPSFTRARRHVLLVDDEAGVRRLVGRLLADEGLDVTLAASAREAVSALDGGCTPDLVLLDRSMPERNGLAVLPDIRARAARARVVFFTGQEVPSSERDQVDDVLPKPVTLAKLQSLLDAWL